MTLSIPIRLQEARTRLGWSQAFAGEQAGISRQAYAAIEAGRSVPSTVVALRLADAMGQSVEGLFRLESPRPIERVVASGGLGGPPAGRVRLARIAGREWAFLLGPACTHGATAADGVGARVVGGARSGMDAQPADGGRVQVRLFADRPQEPDLVVVGCDPAFGLVAERLRRHQGFEVLWLKAGSRAALGALARGAVHVAGTHLRGRGGQGYNAPWIRRLIPFPSTRVTFAEWEQVLLLGPGNPHGIRALEELPRSGLRFLNRGPGTGSRALIEAELARVGIPSSTIAGFDDTAADGHEAVAASVAAGIAGAGVAIRAVGEARGLPLIPLAREPYELVIPNHFLDLPAVEALLAMLRTRSLRTEIEALGGYDTTRMGEPA